mmetsp:Transcript_86390/g.220098  ORF Transcript_86390/g.220098 Transcript_86390/m.220098 type:complete len:242 (+) Transcript_86390:336-1061(+)
MLQQKQWPNTDPQSSASGTSTSGGRAPRQCFFNKTYITSGIAQPKTAPNCRIQSTMQHIRGDGETSSNQLTVFLYWDTADIPMKSSDAPAVIACLAPKSLINTVRRCRRSRTLVCAQAAPKPMAKAKVRYSKSVMPALEIGGPKKRRECSLKTLPRSSSRAKSTERSSQRNSRKACARSRPAATRGAGRCSSSASLRKSSAHREYPLSQLNTPRSTKNGASEAPWRMLRMAMKIEIPGSTA